MATGMKLWLTATLAGIAIVAAWKLPPAPLSPRETRVVPAEVMTAEALNEEFRVTAEALRRVLWSDSLAPLALERAEDGASLLVPGDIELNADQLRRLDARMRAEVAAVRSADVTFAYVLQPSNHAETPDMGPSGRDRTELYVGTLDGQAYCLQVRVHDRGRTALALARKLAGEDRVRPVSGVVGNSRPYLRHGMPGPAIQQWMEDGGAALAVEQGASGVDVRDLGLSATRRTVLGFAGYGYAINTLEGDRCLAGYADACVELLRHPEASNEVLARDLEVARISPVTSIGGSYGFRSLLHDEEYILHDLEQEFGAEAFGRFWRSNDEVEAAFQEAFGVPFGTWIVSWVDRTLGIDEPGPAVSRSSGTGTTLTLALLAGLAYMRTRRRQVT